MPPHLLVLPSPFLGPEPYEPVVAALSARGYGASVAASPAAPVAEDLLAAWTGLAGDLGEPVLVPHSNAGYLAPTVAAAAGGVPVVFVDAALPAPAGGATRLAPPAFREELGRLAGPDGRLPRWTRWWPRDDVAALLPGPLLDRVDAVLPEVPLAYVDGSVDVPRGWAASRCGYLALGTTYAEEWTLAEEHGWPRRRLEAAGHLHLLVEPEETAEAVLALAAEVARG